MLSLPYLNTMGLKLLTNFQVSFLINILHSAFILFELGLYIFEIPDLPHDRRENIFHPFNFYAFPVKTSSDQMFFLFFFSRTYIYAVQYIADFHIISFKTVHVQSIAI